MKCYKTIVGDIYYCKEDLIPNHKYQSIKIDDYSYLKSFYSNFKSLIHREDSHAFEAANGSKQWFYNGLTHREDGPAVEWNTGEKAWYYYGEKINCRSQEEFEKIIKMRAFI